MNSLKNHSLILLTTNRNAPDAYIWFHLISSVHFQLPSKFRCMCSVETQSFPFEISSSVCSLQSAQQFSAENEISRPEGQIGANARTHLFLIFKAEICVTKLKVNVPHVPFTFNYLKRYVRIHVCIPLQTPSRMWRINKFGYKMPWWYVTRTES